MHCPLQAAAAKVGKRARVLIRINPDVDPQVCGGVCWHTWWLFPAVST